MNTSRIGNTAGSLAAMLCACALVACTTTGTNGTGGSGGGGGTAPGGAGGTGPTAGSTGASGVLCPTLTPVIVDFSTATGPDATEIRFGGSGGTSGGGSVWGVSSEIAQGAWHISGTVTTYSGFNVYFDNCSRWDAKAYKGISLTISGTPQNQASTLSLGLPTVDDTTSAAWLISNNDTQAKSTDVGTCTPTAQTGTRYYHPGCADPTKSIDVTTAPTTLTLLWSAFTGGQPDVSPKPDQITGMYWNFSWGDTGSAPYPVDITISALTFIQ